LLLADDQPDVLEMLRFAFTVYGRFEVVGCAANGRQAVSIAVDEQPDIAMLGLMMPLMSGFEAIPLIRSGAPSTRIVILFAVDDVQSRRHAAGADLFLVKGMVPRELARLLSDLVVTRPSSASPN
jgi:DNA-binding NarL/FixJ family response regulator